MADGHWTLQWTLWTVWTASDKDRGVASCDDATTGEGVMVMLLAGRHINIDNLFS